MGRLRKSDVVHSYVIAEAQMLYLSVARARRKNSRESMQQDRVLYRQETVLFDCLMMLYACVEPCRAKAEPANTRPLWSSTAGAFTCTAWHGLQT